MGRSALASLRLKEANWFERAVLHTRRRGIFYKFIFYLRFFLLNFCEFRPRSGLGREADCWWRSRASRPRWGRPRRPPSFWPRSTDSWSRENWSRTRGSRKSRIWLLTYMVSAHYIIIKVLRFAEWWNPRWREVAANHHRLHRQQRDDRVVQRGQHGTHHARTQPADGRSWAHSKSELKKEFFTNWSRWNINQTRLCETMFIFIFHSYLTYLGIRHLKLNLTRLKNLLQNLSSWFLLIKWI